MTNTDSRILLLQMIASLTLCEHMGDVSNVVNKVLKRLGVDIEWDEWADLRRALGERGVTTLYGSRVWDFEEDQ